MAVLLQKQEKLGDQDRKTIRVYSFDVPEGAESLQIEFDYSPRKPGSPESIRPAVEAAADDYFLGQVQDEVYAVMPSEEKEEILQWLIDQTRNQLNFSLYDHRGEFRGWWEASREGARAPVVISQETADFGFVAGEIHAGTWRLELEIHAIVTDTCEFTLSVRTVPKPETPTISFPAPFESSPLPPGPRWYKGELHLHTHHSDGRCSLREMAESAYRKGLHFIALTDHNNTAGMAEISEDLPVTIIPGIEFTTFCGHALGLNIKRHIPWTQDGIPRDPSDLAAEVRGQGGLFCLTHPNTIGDPVFPGCTWIDDRLQASSIDLLEVWHGDYEREAIGTVKTLLLWDALLLEGYRTVAVAGGDRHGAFQDDDPPGMPWTMIHARSAASEDLLEALRCGSVYVTRGPLVELCVDSAEGRTWMGEEVEILNATTYLLRLAVSGVGQGAYTRIFRDGKVFVEMPLSSTRDSDLTFRCMVDCEETWYRAEIYRYAKPRDRLLAFTNPVYVRRKAHGYLST